MADSVRQSNFQYKNSLVCTETPKIVWTVIFKLLERFYEVLQSDKKIILHGAIHMFLKLEILSTFLRAIKYFAFPYLNLNIKLTTACKLWHLSVFPIDYKLLVPSHDS